MSYWNSKFRDVNAEQDILGKTITEINKIDDEIIFTCSDESKYKMYHEHDCCESVSIDKVRGCLDNLIGKVVQSFRSWESPIPDASESGTASYFEIVTENNSARSIIKWEGYSNGYYSEGVSFERIA